MALTSDLIGIRFRNLRKLLSAVSVSPDPRATRPDIISFLATLQVPLAYAWSYNIIRDGNPPTSVADFQGMKVLASRQPCTPLIAVGGDGKVDPVTGLQTYQFAQQTFERQWARPVRYIGFWG